MVGWNLVSCVCVCLGYDVCLWMCDMCCWASMVVVLLNMFELFVIVVVVCGVLVVVDGGWGGVGCWCVCVLSCIEFVVYNMVGMLLIMCVWCLYWVCGGDWLSVGCYVVVFVVSVVLVVVVGWVVVCGCDLLLW